MRHGNRSLYRRIVSSPLASAAALILVIFLARATWSIHEKALESGTKLAEAQAELSKLQTHEADIQGQISAMSTDQGLESELRSKYRAVKDGESVAVIIDDNQSGQSAAVSDAHPTSTLPSYSGGWFSRVLRWFGL